MTEKVKKLKQGPGLDPSITLGPLINNAAVERVRNRDYLSIIPHIRKVPIHTSSEMFIPCSAHLHPFRVMGWDRGKGPLHLGLAWQLINFVVLLCVQVQGHVDDAVAKGATVTVGGKIPDLPEPYNKVGVPMTPYPPPSLTCQ